MIINAVAVTDSSSSNNQILFNSFSQAIVYTRKAALCIIEQDV